MRLRVAVIDDADFGLGDGRGIFGKEVYSELLARINEEYLGNAVSRGLLDISRRKIKDREYVIH